MLLLFSKTSQFVLIASASQQTSFVAFAAEAVKLFFHRHHQNDVIVDQWTNRNGSKLQIFGQLK